MKENKAPTAHKIFETAEDRWSPRAFSDKPMSHEAMLSLLEAARWAPSAFNEQPWRIIAAPRSNPEAFAAMLGCLAEANQSWAKNAQLLLVFVAKDKFTYNGSDNRWSKHDCGLALENLLLQATALGMQAHPMAGFSVEAVRKLYHLPEGFDPVTAVAAGYQGDPDMLEGVLREREKAPRERNPIESFVFEEKWGHPVK